MTPISRPIPTQADRAEAEAFVADEFEADPGICPKWVEKHRGHLVRQLADAEMQVRQNEELKAVPAARRAA